MLTTQVDNHYDRLCSETHRRRVITPDDFATIQVIHKYILDTATEFGTPVVVNDGSIACTVDICARMIQESAPTCQPPAESEARFSTGLPAIDWPVVDTIMLDYGGVLSDQCCEPWQGNLGRLLGVSPAFADELLSETSLWGREYRLGRISRDEFWSAIRRETNAMDADPSELERNWAESYQMNGTMLELVGWLRGRGLRVGVLTNTDAFRHTHIERTHGLSGMVDFLLASHELGAVKPWPGTYLQALRATGRVHQPSRVLFVDDRERNIVGCRAVGMQGLQFKDAASFARLVRDNIGPVPPNAAEAR